jgi:hypothetical protein
MGMIRHLVFAMPGTGVQPHRPEQEPPPRPSPASAGRSHMTKSVLAKNLTLPWRGRVGSVSREARPETGWGDRVLPWPISKVFLAVHPTPALRADPPPPGEGKKNRHRSLSYAIALPASGRGSAPRYLADIRNQRVELQGVRDGTHHAHRVLRTTSPACGGGLGWRHFPTMTNSSIFDVSRTNA